MFQIPLRNSGKNPGGNEQTKEAFVFRSQRKPLNLRATSLPGPQGPQLLCKCHNSRALFPLAIVIHRMSTPISCSRDLIIARRPKARRRENSPNAILPNSKQDVRGRSFRYIQLARGSCPLSKATARQTHLPSSVLSVILARADLRDEITYYFDCVQIATFTDPTKASRTSNQVMFHPKGVK